MMGLRMLKVSYHELADALKEIEHRCDCVVSTVTHRNDAGVLLVDILQDGKLSQTVEVIGSDE